MRYEAANAYARQPGLEHFRLSGTIWCSNFSNNAARQMPIFGRSYCLTTRNCSVASSARNVDAAVHSLYQFHRTRANVHGRALQVHIIKLSLSIAVFNSYNSKRYTVVAKHKTCPKGVYFICSILSTSLRYSRFRFISIKIKMWCSRGLCCFSLFYECLC